MLNLDHLMLRLRHANGDRVCMFQKGELLDLLATSCEMFKAQSSLIRLQAPLHVLGDVHGQFDDLLRLLSSIGDKQLLVLGDYVDRGQRSVEVMVLLLALKLKSPTRVHLLRGNHEFDAVNNVFGFKSEVMRRSKSTLGADPEVVYEAFQKVFDYLPICALVGDRILCMHGGISPLLHNISQLETLPRPLRVLPQGESLVVDLLWADPCDSHGPGYHKSERGISWCFSEEAAAEKCTKLGIGMIVRGHSFETAGYKVAANQKVITVFSAPNYTGRNVNPAGVLHISEDLKCHILTLYVQPPPGIDPAATPVAESSSQPNIAH